MTLQGVLAGMATDRPKRLVDRNWHRASPRGSPWKGDPVEFLDDDLSSRRETFHGQWISHGDDPRRSRPNPARARATHSLPHSVRPPRERSLHRIAPEDFPSLISSACNRPDKSIRSRLRHPHRSSLRTRSARPRIPGSNSRVACPRLRGHGSGAWLPRPRRRGHATRSGTRARRRHEDHPADRHRRRAQPPAWGEPWGVAPAGLAAGAVAGTMTVRQTATWCATGWTCVVITVTGTW